ncbi:hypothetical protein Cgig2_008442 [Carnegiea gigantea]|uniref:DNA (cytosine-5-)-methyltransferase n=1 Tax=Carnegiea gigantea TaxID=171969 RepID=A0A9Q1Q5R4_9CARY|nr:hypothetical protein Cgig2_008442 [Carnegiea gigantea]
MLELPNRSYADRKKSSKRAKKSPDSEDDDCKFLGNSVPADEARRRWPHRYSSLQDKGAKRSVSSTETDEEEKLQARCHYVKAVVDGEVIHLFDDAYIKAEEGKPDYIAKIVELFENVNKEQYLTAQWFYRAEDTVIKDHGNLVDDRRVFFSEIKDDNPLGCIVRKVKIAQIGQNVNNKERRKKIQSAELYCDMRYSLPYLTFANLIGEPENYGSEGDSSSTISSESSSTDGHGNIGNDAKSEVSLVEGLHKPHMTLLDLYSGCGAMSTGLCIGASLSGTKLITKWAVDVNSYACECLRQNHPETEVRNEMAEDFLALLKEWGKLCKELLTSDVNQLEDANDDKDSDDSLSPGEFEVETLLDICYGDPNYTKKRGLYFKGDVDFICGGPPCQGVSGLNRYRDKENPLKDPKNHQLVVFMDIIDHLKPKYVLMENVVDIVKFANGFLGRYAVGRLIGMNYQARLGIMAAGSYGLPQFRLRVFLWGAHISKQLCFSNCHAMSQKLPQYPLPTHDVVSKGSIPTEFEEIYVSHGKKGSPLLEKALLLKDAISDLPPVPNDEDQDERPYGGPPQSEFQKFIRLKREDIISFSAPAEAAPEPALYDHRPLQMNEDDYQRAYRIPKQKGANFRNLPGLQVNAQNKVELDPTVERVYLPSKKPLVPDYAIKFVRGISTKIWWDETVSTVTTRAEPHVQAILHPEQDRVLTIRENARLQGFPDCYKLHGPVKERYIQVGNAVAVPVALALGYSFGNAVQGLVDDQPLTTLPMKFPQCLARKQD